MSAATPTGGVINRAKLPPCITVKEWPGFDVYSGPIEAMLAAGIVSPEQLPGLPGHNKHNRQFLADGSQIGRPREAGGKGGVYARYEPGAKSIHRSGNRLSVHITLTKEAAKCRDAQLDQLNAERLRQAQRPGWAGDLFRQELLKAIDKGLGAKTVEPPTYCWQDADAPRVLH